jgi:hypothetical protein
MGTTASGTQEISLLLNLFLLDAWIPDNLECTVFRQAPYNKQLETEIELA